jgi:hypothetical protein
MNLRKYSKSRANRNQSLQNPMVYIGIDIIREHIKRHKLALLQPDSHSDHTVLSHKLRPGQFIITRLFDCLAASRVCVFLHGRLFWHKVLCLYWSFAELYRRIHTDPKFTPKVTRQLSYTHHGTSIMCSLSAIHCVHYDRICNELVFTGSESHCKHNSFIVEQCRPFDRIACDTDDHQPVVIYRKSVIAYFCVESIVLYSLSHTSGHVHWNATLKTTFTAFSQ